MFIFIKRGLLKEKINAHIYLYFRNKKQKRQKGTYLKLYKIDA